MHYLLSEMLPFFLSSWEFVPRVQPPAMQAPISHGDQDQGRIKGGKGSEIQKLSCFIHGKKLRS